MPLPPIPPPSISQAAASAPSIEEIILAAKDAISGHQAAVAEAERKWSGQAIHIMTEGLDESGQFHLTFSHEPNDAGASATGMSSQKKDADQDAASSSNGISTPRAVIFLTGDSTSFGDMSSEPPSAGSPIIVATRGDGEDHQIMDSRWKAALSGQELLWSSRLSWKYRTQTVVFRDKTTGHAILEQGGAAIDCGITPSDPRKTVERCLSDDPQDSEPETGSQGAIAQ